MQNKPIDNKFLENTYNNIFDHLHKSKYFFLKDRDLSNSSFSEEKTLEKITYNINLKNEIQKIETLATKSGINNAIYVMKNSPNIHSFKMLSKGNSKVDSNKWISDFTNFLESDNCKLNHIDFGDVKISNNNMLKILQACQDNTHITSLNFSDNNNNNFNSLNNGLVPLILNKQNLNSIEFSDFKKTDFDTSVNVLASLFFNKNLKTIILPIKTCEGLRKKFLALEENVNSLEIVRAGSSYKKCPAEKIAQFKEIFEEKFNTHINNVESTDFSLEDAWNAIREIEEFEFKELSNQNDYKILHEIQEKIYKHGKASEDKFFDLPNCFYLSKLCKEESLLQVKEEISNNPSIKHLQSLANMHGVSQAMVVLENNEQIKSLKFHKRITNKKHDHDKIMANLINGLEKSNLEKIDFGTLKLNQKNIVETLKALENKESLKSLHYRNHEKVNLEAFNSFIINNKSTTNLTFNNNEKNGIEHDVEMFTALHLNDSLEYVKIPGSVCTEMAELFSNIEHGDLKVEFKKTSETCIGKTLHGTKTTKESFANIVSSKAKELFEDYKPEDYEGTYPEYFDNIDESYFGIELSGDHSEL